jgi:hypothetical protein
MAVDPPIYAFMTKPFLSFNDGLNAQARLTLFDLSSKGRTGGRQRPFA